MLDQKNAQCLITVATQASDVRKRWSETLCDICLVHETTDLESLKRNLSSLKPSVLLLDQALPEFSVAAHFGELQALSSLTKILVFSQSVDKQEAIQALTLGACGFFHRDIDTLLLRKAIDIVRRGEIWVSRSIIPVLLTQLRSSANEISSKTDESLRRAVPNRRRTDPVPAAKVESGLPGLHLGRLTFREQQIAQLVASGGSNKEIASRLRITESTVKAHLTAIFRKVGVPDRLGLALFIAQQQGQLQQ